MTGIGSGTEARETQIACGRDEMGGHNDEGNAHRAGDALAAHPLKLVSRAVASTKQNQQWATIGLDGSQQRC